MENTFHFPYRTRSGLVDVHVSWGAGARDHEDLTVEIEAYGPAAGDLCESTRAKIRAEAHLAFIFRHRRGTELGNG